MGPSLANSRGARDFMLLAPFVGFVLFLLAFFAFLYLVFLTDRVDTEDQATLVLITSVVNQGFSLAMFMAGYIYYRESHQRAPFRREDVLKGQVDEPPP